MLKVSSYFFFIASFFASSQAMCENGAWLIGITGGYAERDGSYELNIGQPAPLRLVTTVLKSVDKSGTLWGGFIGYELKSLSWVIGGELNIEHRSLNDKDYYAFTTVNNVGFNADMQYDQGEAIGLTGRIGYQLTPCILPYIRLGVETSKDMTLSFAEVNGGTTGGFIGGEWERRYRFTGGIGAEFPFICDLTFRLEYDYASKGEGSVGKGFANDNITYIETHVKACTNMGKASFVYHF